MPRRENTPQDDEKRSYGALWLVLSLVLFVCALWAVADDNFFRRPWKKWQAGFGRLEISRIEDAIAAEQAKLNADPKYQEAVKSLEVAKAKVDSGETATEISALEDKLAAARLVDKEKDLNLRFVKSELEELRYHFDEAKHHGHPTDAIMAEIQKREQLRAERQKIFAESQAHIAEIENAIKDKQAAVKSAEDAIAHLSVAKEDLQQKLETVSLGKYPGPTMSPPFIKTEWQPKIPKIQQVVLEEYDRNAYNQPVARVDRCPTCHIGINKVGFEDQPNPWKTHPRRELFLSKHDPGKFGCTACHNGDGTAVNSEKYAHCDYYDEQGTLEEVHLRESLALYRGPKMQSNCIKCHASVQHLEGAEVLARGEKLFIDLGCHGCHLAEGYEDLSKEHGVTAIGPSLRRIGAKADPAWMVQWVKNPHVFRPRTRMPNFVFNDTQAEKITAYLLDITKAPSDEWLAANPDPGITPGGAQAEKGRQLMDTLGCRACHALAPDEVAGTLGVDKDIAPNLSQIAAKTDGRWMYHWIKDPRGYSSVSRMPSLRLTDDEANAITAYLLTLGQKTPPVEGLAARLADPMNVADGQGLVRKYGCAGCHDIPGMESESRIGAELSTYGNKTKEELFFGDRTDLQETWDVFTYHKIKEPRGYATQWIEQLMPVFDLADEDIYALRVFLTSRTELRVPGQYRFKSADAEQVVHGERLVARYNCTGCHIIEGKGGDIRRLYETQITMAPPNLLGEGAKVQQPWLFNFLKAPTPIRPWLQVRMPTFGLDNPETTTAVDYFAALDDVTVPFVHIDRASLTPSMVEAGALLASTDYLSCFSCHVRGNQNPEGSPDSWAPNLAMASSRLHPDWIVKWLEDPQKLMPGTKMPTFYADPNVTDGPPDVLGGDDNAQIRALRDYVISLGLPSLTPPPAQSAAVVPAGPGATQ
ncbi:MAG TPA: c-type cytochrome [Candidatus Binatia bacterium]|nr:c-type cytochrome [Candidatus Binatia bacterium]